MNVTAYGYNHALEREWKRVREGGSKRVRVKERERERSPTVKRACVIPHMDRGRGEIM